MAVDSPQCICSDDRNYMCLTVEAWEQTKKGGTIANREAWVYKKVDLDRAHSNVMGALPCSMSALTGHFLCSNLAVLSRGGGHPTVASDRCEHF